MPKLKTIDGRGEGTLLMVSTRDNARIHEHSWMKGRLLNGDFVICLEIPEPNRYCWYQLVSVGSSVLPGRGSVYQLLPHAEFQSLGIGEKLPNQPSEDVVRRLLAGEAVTIDNKPEPTPRPLTLKWSSTPRGRVAHLHDSENDTIRLVGFVEPIDDTRWMAWICGPGEDLRYVQRVFLLDAARARVEEHAMKLFGSIRVEG